MSDFDLGLTAAQREHLGRATLEWVLHYFVDQTTLPVYPNLGASELTARLSNVLPIEPQSAAQVLADFEDVAR
jgi:hypothetical protein